MKKISYSKDAAKALRRMPRDIGTRVRDKINAYAVNPASQANNVKALRGVEEIRLRVGDWRVIMNDRGEVLVIIKIAPRGNAY